MYGAHVYLVIFVIKASMILIQLKSLPHLCKLEMSSKCFFSCYPFSVQYERIAYQKYYSIDLSETILLT